MEQREEELIQQYAAIDEELKELYVEHLELKHQLEAFRNKAYPTTDEELEKKRIQKLKLASKDRMMESLSRHQQQARDRAAGSPRRARCPPDAKTHHICNCRK